MRGPLIQSVAGGAGKTTGDSTECLTKAGEATMVRARSWEYERRLWLLRRGVSGSRNAILCRHEPSPQGFESQFQVFLSYRSLAQLPQRVHRGRHFLDAFGSSLPFRAELLPLRLEDALHERLAAQNGAVAEIVHFIPPSVFFVIASTDQKSVCCIWRRKARLSRRNCPGYSI